MKTRSSTRATALQPPSSSIRTSQFAPPRTRSRPKLAQAAIIIHPKLQEVKLNGFEGKIKNRKRRLPVLANGEKGESKPPKDALRKISSIAEFKATPSTALSHWSEQSRSRNAFLDQFDPNLESKQQLSRRRTDKLDRKDRKLKKIQLIKSGKNRFNQTPLFEDTQSTISGIFTFDQHQAMGDVQKGKFIDLSKASASTRDTYTA